MIDGECGDLVQPVWRRFESETGEITKVDMKSIEAMPPFGVNVQVYTFVPGSNFDLDHLRTLYFTCRGQFSDYLDTANLMDAPPLSMAGTIASAVCPIGDVKRSEFLARRAVIERQQEERALHPRLEDYCQGFSAKSCEEIRAGVEAKAIPTYCGPSSAFVGSGLTAEQVRTCQTRGPVDAQNEENGGQLKP